MKNNPSHQNLPGSFRELSLSDLKQYAKEWVETFPNTIKKICLYNYSPPLRIMAALEESAGGRFSVMYVIVFEAYDVQKVFEFFLDNPIGDYSFCELSEIQNKALLDFKALENATGKNTTLKNKAYRPLLRNRFPSVYKSPPKDTWLNQWTFIHKLPNERLSSHVRVSEEYWVLYQGKEKYPQEVIRLVRNAKPEIEMIYGAIKKDIGFSARIPDLECKLEEKVKEVFNRRKNNFKLVEENYLEDNNLYILNPGQSRRDFIGRLLKKIVKNKTGEKYGAQNLYETYKEITD